MVWLICKLVLTKSGLINNYLVLLISNIIALFSNIPKSILSIISCRNQLKYSQNKCNLFICILIHISTLPISPKRESHHLMKYIKLERITKLNKNA